jgi:hypothetical protein
MYDKVFAEIAEERQHQADEWNASDLANLAVRDAQYEDLPARFTSFIARYASAWVDKEGSPISAAHFRECMVKTAALAVSAIMAVDYRATFGMKREDGGVTVMMTREEGAQEVLGHIRAGFDSDTAIRLAALDAAMKRFHPAWTTQRLMEEIQRFEDYLRGK